MDTTQTLKATEKVMDITVDNSMELAPEQALRHMEYVVSKNYLMQLQKTQALDTCKQADIEKIANHAKFFHVQRIVYSKNENTLQKLTNVYAAAHIAEANLCMLIHSDGKAVDLYLGVQNMIDADPALQAVFSNLRGNFPGSLGAESAYNDLCMNDNSMRSNLNLWLDNDDDDAIASVSGVPATREEKIEDNNKYVQGIEKVIDTMRGKRFTAIILAQNIPDATLSSIKAEYEAIYSQLSPYAKQVISFGENQTSSVTDSLSHSVSESFGVNKSASLSIGKTEGISHGTSESISLSVGIAKGYGVGMSAGPMSASTSTTGIVSTTGTKGRSTTESESNTTTNTETHGTQETTGKVNTQGNATTQSTGNSYTYQIEAHNKVVEDMLKQIDVQLKRLQESECYGMFGAAAYFIAANKMDALTAAGAYKSIISGHTSYAETAQINIWSKTLCKIKGDTSFDNVRNSLRCLRHPSFKMSTGDIVTPASLVSAQELAVEMGIPMHSVPGITVIETAPFGRNIYRTGNIQRCNSHEIRLGKIYHMWEEEDATVTLNADSLASHTFITGSTGAGKSNTIYQLVSELHKNDVPFMVIEPAKGEYKQVLGGYDDVQVYGVNEKITKLLRMNPFTLPESIDVLEHVDRLVEIFSACWPMYAAMPAILKDAIETCYANKGWDLVDSVCDGSVFPTLSDLLEVLPGVVEKSSYSKDTQSDYAGALVTRVRSLTNGLYGKVLCSREETSLKALFDENVIIDLSRVNAMETKSLFMGILVMKLQEYRMSKGKMNSELRHVTVLEEAHNLLRRTSQEQTQEGSNLQGKSVEMIGNAIAEMRTYGEGFIIADQAPGLMDMAVIRNTNTKIIMRLPDAEDRKLVGFAAGLNEDQISELAKLERGVAAVYQNDWLEPVLCKVKHYSEEKPYTYQPPKKRPAQELKKLLYLSLLGKANLMELSPEDADRLRRWIEAEPFGAYTRKHLGELIDGKMYPARIRNALLYNMLDGQRFAMMTEEAVDDEVLCSDIKTTCGIDDYELLHEILSSIRRAVNELQTTPEAAKDESVR